MPTEHEFLLETSDFTEILTNIGDIVSDDFSEDEVQMTFLNEGYFQKLGYEEIGTNLRSEFSVSSGFVDYVTTGHGDTLRDTRTVVYEFKEPNKSLSSYLSQLDDYVDDTGAKYGVLTNGHRFQLYQSTPTNLELLEEFELKSATRKEASLIILSLGYWSIEEQNLKPVAEMAAEEVVDSIPDEMHMQFSEEGIELFAKHFSRYLRQGFQSEGPSQSTD